MHDLSAFTTPSGWAALNHRHTSRVWWSIGQLHEAVITRVHARANEHVHWDYARTVTLQSCSVAYLPLSRVRTYVQQSSSNLRNMAIVFHLPPRSYQFLALQTVVYWAIVAGHMASGYSLFIGIPLLPLLVVQITLLIHIWTSLVTKHQFQPTEPLSTPTSPNMHDLAAPQWVF